MSRFIHFSSSGTNIVRRFFVPLNSIPSSSALKPSSSFFTTSQKQRRKPSLPPLLTRRHHSTTVSSSINTANPSLTMSDQTKSILISETKNYYTQPFDLPLNRLSWLRTDKDFLNNAFHHPKARFLCFHQLKPLVRVPASSSSEGDNHAKIEWVEKKEIESLWDATLLEKDNLFRGIDGKEYEGMEKNLPKADEDENSKPALIFLGISQEEGGPDVHGSGGERLLPEKPHTEGEASREEGMGKEKGGSPTTIVGTPLWTVSLSPPTISSSFHPSPAFTPKYETFLSRLEETRKGVLEGGKDGGNGEEGKREFMDPRMRGAGALLDWEGSGIVAMGRTLLDWNEKNRYCPSCSRPTRSIWAGWKRSCHPIIPDGSEGKEEACSTTKGIHNFQYPRSDPVVIMAILDHKREKVLLGRQKSWAPNFWSLLSGFIEPGESLEDAVRREVWEEAGVKVNEVFYHCSQPWPYPASFMIGCIGVADENTKIRTDLDNELEDALFVSRSDLLSLFSTKDSTLSQNASQSGNDIVHLDSKDHLATKKEEEKISAEEEEERRRRFDPKEVRIPPPTAIGYNLVKWFAVGGGSGSGSLGSSTK